MKLITQGTSLTIQDILSRNGEKINVKILLITVPKPRGWHLASTAFSCLVPLSMNQPKGQISAKACIFICIYHNKHISFIWKTVTFKNKHHLINLLKVKCSNLYSVLYVVKKIFKSICFTLEYIVNYFPLEKVDFQLY